MIDDWCKYKTYVIVAKSGLSKGSEFHFDNNEQQQPYDHQRNGSTVNLSGLHRKTCIFIWDPWTNICFNGWSICHFLSRQTIITHRLVSALNQKCSWCRNHTASWREKSIPRVMHVVHIVYVLMWFGKGRFQLFLSGLHFWNGEYAQGAVNQPEVYRLMYHIRTDTVTTINRKATKLCAHQTV